jgi:hypothetical protein
MHDQTDRFQAHELVEFVKARLVDGDAQPPARLKTLATNYAKLSFCVAPEDVPRILECAWSLIAYDFEKQRDKPPDVSRGRKYVIRKVRDAIKRLDRRRRELKATPLAPLIRHRVDGPKYDRPYKPTAERIVIVINERAAVME